MNTQVIAERKASIDMREWLQHQGYRPRSRGARAWTFACPLHGETHGAALAVWQDGWRCFGACGTGGDILTFVMRRDNCDFRTACQTLGLQDDAVKPGRKTSRKVISPSKPVPSPSEPPAEALQARLRALVDEGQANLHGGPGKAALEYLCETRGLTPDTVRKAQLGYSNPRPDGKPWRWNDLIVPSGAILMPWFAGGHLWGIKTRNPWATRPDQRYLSVKAEDEHALGRTNLAGALYWADHITSRTTVLIVEGEFNCLTAYQEYFDICPVSLGTAGATLNVRWYPYLLTAPRLLACFDRDKAGDAARSRLGALASGVRFIQTPDGIKDINDYWTLARETGHFCAVSNWLADVVHGEETAITESKREEIGK